MVLTVKVLQIVLALLVGIYTGINLSGIHYLQNKEIQHKSNLRQNDRIAQELQQAKAEVKAWQEKALQMGKDYAGAVNKVDELEGFMKDCNKNEVHASRENRAEEETKATNPNKHPICQQFSYPTPSAFSLWNLKINSILEATRLMPNDPDFNFHDFTTEVMQIITPRLPRSVKSIPYEWGSVERAMSVAWERYQYLQLSQEKRDSVDSPPRPLKILVMGGSVLVGRNCRKLLSELRLGEKMGLPNRDCTWSNRLDSFLNSYFGDGIAEVTKVAMGGTNTETGNVIWRYDLIPEYARNPDIVLNAYSTNDMHVLTILEAQSANSTLRDKVFDMTQNYVRDILHTCDSSKPPPLLLHMDDYLGNEQRKVWDTTELSQGVQVLANYYGFPSFSYADVVRDIVYGDTYESWFSADWWETGKFEREIHPGMGMHIASTWVTVFNMLNLVTTYCSMSTIPISHTISNYEEGLFGLPKLRLDVAQAKGKPKPHPKGLPPVLTKDLLIEDVTSLWKEAEENTKACESREDSTQYSARCPFSWVSGLSLQQNNQTFVEEYFKKKASVWNGWVLGNDGGKIGFVPTKTNASEMELEFLFSQTIRSVTLFFMKSYGAKWQNSELQVRTRRLQSEGPNVVDERRLLGFHGKNTSEMYTEAIELSEPIPAGAGLKVGVKLVGGTTFKLMGLAVCT